MVEFESSIELKENITRVMEETLLANGIVIAYEFVQLTVVRPSSKLYYVYTLVDLLCLIAFDCHYSVANVFMLLQSHKQSILLLYNKWQSNC